MYEITIKTLDLSPTTRVKYDSFSNYGISNVEFAFLYHGFTRYPDNNYTYPFHTSNCTVQLNGLNDQIIFINDNANGRNQDIYATIRYTKTTD